MWKNIVDIILLTIHVSGTALVIAVLIGIPLALLIVNKSSLLNKIIRIIVNTGMGFPPVVIGLLVFLLISNRGPLGFTDWLFTPKGMILAQVILAIPFVSGLTISAIDAVSPKLILQVRSFGATKFQEKVAAICQAHKGILIAILAAFGRIISEVGAVMLVGGNIDGSTRVLSTAIVLETRKGEFEFAIILGMILLGIGLLVNGFMMFFSSGEHHE
jgi:tungstate transport system permease protein